MHAPQQQRVVGEQQVGPEVAGLLDDREGGVDGEVHAAHGLVGVPGDQADAVPGLGGGRRVEALDDLEHLAQGRWLVLAHVGPAGIEPTTDAV